MTLSNIGSGDGRRRLVSDWIDSGAFDRFGRPDLQEVAALLSTISFWSAIALPLVYLPILVAGIESVSRLALFLGLFGLHVLALVGGHGHATPARR